MVHTTDFERKKRAAHGNSSDMPSLPNLPLPIAQIGK